MPAPLYYMSCDQAHPLLYQLEDGRLQRMTQGTLAPFMAGYEYVLIENTLAQHLASLLLPDVIIRDAVIFDPQQGKELTTHKRLCIGAQFTAEQLADLDVPGERMLLMEGRYVFASSTLRQRLSAAPFSYLKFSEGLEEFVGSEIQWTSTGENTLTPEQLDKVRYHLEEVGFVVVLWRRWFGAASPTPLSFDDCAAFIEFLRTKPKIGDVVDVWPFPDDPATRLAGGKIPSKHGWVPIGGAY